MPILGRYKFYVDTRDSGFGANVLLDGYWEIWLTQFLARTVKPGMRVIDVGANFGYYTLLLADLVGPGGEVCAVEPNPQVAPFLTQSVELNGFSAHTRIVVAAAAAIDGGQARLFAPHGEPKNAAILADGMQMATDSGSFHTVLTRTIDSLATELGGLDVIKIDAEGAEEGIFEGMAEAIRQYRPAIVLEFNAARYRDPRDFLGRMKRAYGALRYIDNAGKPKTVSEGEVLTRNFGEDWLLFLAPE